MNDIEPCPFCAYESPKLTEKRSGNYRRTGDMFQVLCGRCKGRGPIVTAKYEVRVSANYQTKYISANASDREAAKQKAIELWNNRAEVR